MLYTRLSGGWKVAAGSAGGGVAAACSGRRAGWPVNLGGFWFCRFSRTGAALSGTCLPLPTAA